jgi:hypothetical protein
MLASVALMALVWAPQTAHAANADCNWEYHIPESHEGVYDGTDTGYNGARALFKIRADDICTQHVPGAPKGASSSAWVTLTDAFAGYSKWGEAGYFNGNPDLTGCASSGLDGVYFTEWVNGSTDTLQFGCSDTFPADTGLRQISVFLTSTNHLRGQYCLSDGTSCNAINGGDSSFTFSASDVSNDIVATSNETWQTESDITGLSSAHAYQDTFKGQSSNGGSWSVLAGSHFTTWMYEYWANTNTTDGNVCAAYHNTWTPSTARLEVWTSPLTGSSRC